MSLWSNLTDKFDTKTGLALSGGAVYGAAHVGVLKALEEYDVKVDAIAGTSIGAFIGALYAFGLKSEEIEKSILDVDWYDISSLSLSQFGLLSNKKMGQFLQKHIGKAEFKDANIELHLIATDITSGETIILNEGSVAEAVMASASIPGIFKPIELNDRLLVDGGVVENLPISPLKKRHMDRIIAVDLNSKHQSERPENIIELLLNAFHFTLMNSTKQAAAEADILIQPDLSSFNRLETSQVTKLVERGYTEAKKVLGN